MVSGASLITNQMQGKIRSFVEIQIDSIKQVILAHILLDVIKELFKSRLN